jgi:hypothetical protein
MLQTEYTDNHAIVSATNLHEAFTYIKQLKLFEDLRHYKVIVKVKVY